MNPTNPIAEQNTDRLLETASVPDPVPAEFAANLQTKLLETAAAMQQTTTTLPTPNRYRRFMMVAAGLAACVVFVAAYSTIRGLRERKADSLDPTPNAHFAKWTDDVANAMMPRKRPEGPTLATLADGQSLTTKSAERRLVQLGDGTRVFVNEKTHVEAIGPRRVTLHKGEIYLEVAARDNGPRFVVQSAGRVFTATGTHFAVQSDAKSAGVIVTQGKVAVNKIAAEVSAGQQVKPGADEATPAPRASHTLQWTRDLMAAAETPMVPSCQHAGGALLALDPQGQEIKLALRQYHIDVHIEDGFARTTIDQTYFNTTWERLEGTFYFPLPPDASLSRLAMYVANGNECVLMEGGMAERKHAADVYETIRYQRRDPALLEWLDGSTFKMRVFPLEAKQEKRIILSYTQKVPTLYGTARYRFPGGLNMPIVRDWSFQARVKNGGAMNLWSPSHADLNLLAHGPDMLASTHAKNVKPAEDVVLEMQDRVPLAGVDRDVPRFSSFVHENQTYLMLRYRPTLPSLPERQRRDWIVLVEASAQRDPLLAGTQVDVFRQLLKNAEYDDTFTLMTVNSKVQALPESPGVRYSEPLGYAGRPARPQNVDAAVKFLQETHLVGALNLEQGLEAAVKHAQTAKNPHILHIGSGTPAMGERDAAKLAALLPDSVRYVGVGVGKRWNRAFMKAAAERTGGLFTQINPDEVIAWRAFELLATLNTPRLLDVHVVDANEKANFLTETTMLAQGEEICALTRVDFNKVPMPSKALLRGTLNGKAFTKEFPVSNVQAGADYLPRMWAKHEIDRLLAAGSAKHKDEIISLSKAMYVMSPFTSLLVLETEADYERFKVDKGRKDHWAMYACPAKIPVVYEPNGPAPTEVKVNVKMLGQKPSVEEVLKTIALPARGFMAIDFDPVMTEDEVDIQYTVDRIKGISVPGSVNPLEAIGIKAIKDIDAVVLRQAIDAIQGRMGPRPSGFAGGSRFSFGGGGFGPGVWGNLPMGEQGKKVTMKLRELSPNRSEAIESYFRKLKAPALAKPGDPFARMETMLVESESRGIPQDEVRRFWMNDQPAHLTPYRIHGGVRNGVFDWDDVKPAIHASQLYNRPTFTYDHALFTNLLQYAPGLHTADADILATLEQEADVEPVKLGVIDPAARKLIDKARSSNWFALTMPAEGPLPSWTIYYNMLGQFTYERRLVSGLFEQVICNGRSLWHLYPEIGLASHRKFSRHHHGLLTSFARAFLPDADELARGCDVKAVDGQTVEVRAVGSRQKAVGSGQESAAADRYSVHYVFAKDGRLSERRVVEMPAGKALVRQVFDPDGFVEWKGADGKVIAKQTLAIAPAKMQDVSPKLNELVVMQMPIRTVDYYNKWASSENSEYVEQAVVSECVTYSGNDALLLHASRHFNKKMDRRVGFCTLLTMRDFPFFNVPNPASKENAWPWLIEPKTEQPACALVRFLAHRQRERINNAQPPLDDLPGPQDHFIHKLARFRNLLITLPSAFNNRKEPHDGGPEWQKEKASIPGKIAKAFAFLKETTSPVFAYALLDLMQRDRTLGTSEEMTKLAFERFGPISDPLGLGYVFRYEYAISLARAGLLRPGKSDESAKMFKELHSDTVKAGVLPPVDASFRQALAETKDGYGGFVRQVADELLAKKRLGLAFQLARQMEQLGDEVLADEVLTAILAVKVSPEERTALKLAGANFLTQRKSFARADRLVQEVMAESSLTLQALNQAALWRWRYELTRDAGQTVASIGCLEKALDLEYRELPELVNLESIRADYRLMLGHYAKVAEALALVNELADSPKERANAKPQAALVAKVIRTADRWRLIEPESGEACMLAGSILHTLGLGDLAWDYWTTPIDLHPAESKPWTDLAETLKGVSDFERADRAFAIAFETEPSNPEILAKRAQNLTRMGQHARARQLYTQIAEGQWQERFAAVVMQARGLARP